MKLASARNLVAALALATSLSLSANAATITVGNDPTVQGAVVDGCTHCTFVLGQAFGVAGATVTSYSFFTKTNAGDITPILYTLSGSTFTVTGIGATQTFGGGTATQLTYNFGLVPVTGGSAVTTPNTYFGFYNSNGSIVSYTDTQTAVNGGAYAFGTSAPVLGQQFTFGPGTSNNAYDVQLTRLYSANATAVTTPEPSSLALLGTGLAGLGGLVKRRFKRS